MKVTKEMLTDTVAKFTWTFGCDFFLETPIGNFVWSDPDYHGDNTIKPYKGSIRDYFGNSFGSDKGKHTVAGYCGEDFIFVEEEKL